jgi:hypothetical protein
MLKKPAVLAMLGAGGGVAVALLLFAVLFGFGRGAPPAESAEPTPQPTPVGTRGKLGPHITLVDRIFNLQTEGGTPVYLKLQTIVEFETTDERWARALDGCHAARSLTRPELVSVARGGAAPAAAPRPVPAAPGEGGAGAACEAEQAGLLAEFQSEIGSGRQLIEDAVTTIVSGKTPAELSTLEGKERLKEEIKEAVESLLEGHHVTRVLFVNFITQ